VKSRPARIVIGGDVEACVAGEAAGVCRRQILAVRRGDDARRVDRLDRVLDGDDVGGGQRPLERAVDVPLVLDVDEQISIRPHRIDGGGDRAPVQARVHAGDVLGRERHVDDDPPRVGGLEDAEQLGQVVRIECAVRPHQLRTVRRIRPDADPVEARRLHEIQVGDEILRAHRAKVGDEHQEARRPVDREPPTIDAEPLSRRFAGRAESGEE